MSKLDTVDMSWAPTTTTNISHVVVYQDKRVRDWRYLWLRHKTITTILYVDAT